MPHGRRTESILNQREKKKEYLDKYWCINLTSKVHRILEQGLKEQINKDMEVKEY